MIDRDNIKREILEKTNIQGFAIALYVFINKHVIFVGLITKQRVVKKLKEVMEDEMLKMTDASRIAIGIEKKN